MKLIKNTIGFIFYWLILPSVIIFGGWQGWRLWNWSISAPMVETQDAEKKIQFNIPPGTAATQIGEQLEAKGIIRSAMAWKLWTYWLQLHDSEGEYKAGTYQLSATEPLPAIAKKIWVGKVVQVNFTIPEGWTIKQMGEYFQSKGFFSADEFIAAASKIPQDKYPWLPDGLPHLEGFLYPDTYKISSDRLSAQRIVTIMLDEFEQVALPVYQQTKNQTQLNLVQWVTLASIVEKESVVPQERSLIAGVFTKRLVKGMKLQADPTVEYGLGIKQTADRPLTYSQVATPSPYNTYVNFGLPPTPIASPGIASLKATLYPAKTEYLYFVARYDGTHVFSRTLAEHEAATRAIRRQRQNQPRKSSS